MKSNTCSIKIFPLDQGVDKGNLEYWSRMKNLPWAFPFCLISTWKNVAFTMYYGSNSPQMCWIFVWFEVITSLIFWRCPTSKIQQLILVPHMHICVCSLSTWWYFKSFYYIKNVLLFPTTLLCTRTSFSDRLKIKRMVSSQFMSKRRYDASTPDYL